jgi:hypothetical protein
MALTKKRGRATRRWPSLDSHPFKWRFLGPLSERRKCEDSCCGTLHARGSQNMSSKYGFQGPGETKRQEHGQQLAESAELQGRTEELERIYGSIDSKVRDLLKDFLATVDEGNLNISRGELHYPTYSSDPPHLAMCWNVGDVYERFRGSSTTPMIYPMHVYIKYDGSDVRIFAETSQAYIFSNGNMILLRKMLQQATGLRAS